MGPVWHFLPEPDVAWRVAHAFDFREERVAHVLEKWARTEDTFLTYIN